MHEQWAFLFTFEENYCNADLVCYADEFETYWSAWMEDRPQSMSLLLYRLRSMSDESSDLGRVKLGMKP